MDTRLHRRSVVINPRCFNLCAVAWIPERAHCHSRDETTVCQQQKGPDPLLLLSVDRKKRGHGLKSPPCLLKTSESPPYPPVKTFVKSHFPLIKYSSVLQMYAWITCHALSPWRSAPRWCSQAVRKLPYWNTLLRVTVMPRRGPALCTRHIQELGVEKLWI